MSRYHSYINSAKEILESYKGEEPLASFQKKFFVLHKKYGSRDRKQISHLCYCYFRLGKLNPDMPVEERVLLGLFLCSTQPDDILEQLKPEWNKSVSVSIDEKLALLHAKKNNDRIFPFADGISIGIDKDEFISSLLIQPDVFLRLRPGKESLVNKKLENAAISFTVISNSCLALPNASKIDSVIELNKEAVVQDHSSQRVGEFLLSVRPGRSDGVADRVWDCCAASGGKSIMLYDLYPKIDLTVSDVRVSILINLKKRFGEAGITNYKSFIADLTTSNFQPPTSSLQLPTPVFDLIIADIPCSGSGTWSRTPEQLFYFKKEKISEYADLQKKIVSNIIPHLKPGGHLLYVTCSVFKKENEEVVAFIEQNFPLRVLKKEVLKGYDKKADTMFAAMLQKDL